MSDRPDPGEEVRRLYEEAEQRTSAAMEEVVKRDAFGELLARMTENVMAVTRMSNDAADAVVRNLRIAGRRDITNLARQLARTEDKLEMVLQEVERLQDQVREARESERRAAASDGAAGDANGSSGVATGKKPARSKAAAAAHESEAE